MVGQIANVTIERPERYAKQLASHMGHKLQVKVIEGGWELIFDIGSATLTSDESTLTMTTDAESQEDIEKIQFALVKHLVKFAAKLDPLEIVWK